MYILIVFFCLHNIKYLGTKKFQEIEKQPQPKDTPLSLKKKKKSRKYIRKTNSEVFFFSEATSPDIIRVKVRLLTIFLLLDYSKSSVSQVILCFIFVL